MRSDVGCLRFSDGWSLFWAHHRHSDNYYLINRLSRAPSERQDRYREVGQGSAIPIGLQRYDTRIMRRFSAVNRRQANTSYSARRQRLCPFGVRDVLPVFLVGTLGCQRESGEAAVIVGANIGTDPVGDSPHLIPFSIITTVFLCPLSAGMLPWLHFVKSPQRVFVTRGVCVRVSEYPFHPDR
jgi:hypothetical protein